MLFTFIYFFFLNIFVYIFHIYIYTYLSLLILTWIVFTNVKVLPYHGVCCCCRFLWAPWMVEDTAKTFVSSILHSAYLGRRRNTEKLEETYSVVTSNHGKKHWKNCWKKMKAMKRWKQHLRLWEHQTERSLPPACFCCIGIFCAPETIHVLIQKQWGVEILLSQAAGALGRLWKVGW